MAARESFNAFGRPRRRGRRIILKRTLEWDGEVRIYLADDGERWQALVNAVMNLGVPQNAGNCMTEGLYI